jgi:hypothetical protein
MRIANPHLLSKKSRFISYPTKKSKATKKGMPSETELSKVLTPEPEMQSLIIAEPNVKPKKPEKTKGDSIF